MSDCLIVIPSRYGSTCFPGKVLTKLGGRPIVEWCHEAARRTGLGDVVVATEDKWVAEAVKLFGGQAVMTSADCVSGTDRVFEAARKRSFRIVINLQGDQPLVKPETLGKVARLLEDERADIATPRSCLWRTPPG